MFHVFLKPPLNLESFKGGYSSEVPFEFLFPVGAEGGKLEIGGEDYSPAKKAKTNKSAERVPFLLVLLSFTANSPQLWILLIVTKFMLIKNSPYIGSTPFHTLLIFVKIHTGIRGITTLYPVFHTYQKFQLPT
jgi:hypothetical protein